MRKGRLAVLCTWGNKKSGQSSVAPLSVSIGVHLWLPSWPLSRGKGRENKKVVKQFPATLNLSTRLFPKNLISLYKTIWSLTAGNWQLAAGGFPSVFICVHLWLTLFPPWFHRRLSLSRGERHANKKVVKQFLRTLNLGTKLFSKKHESPYKTIWSLITT